LVDWDSINNPRSTMALLGRRLMVGQVPLEHFVYVRILAAQPENQLLAPSQFGIGG
jgi:hypothetical protein